MGATIRERRGLSISSGQELTFDGTLMPSAQTAPPVRSTFRGEITRIATESGLRRVEISTARL
jgi:hypothetical protein